MKFQVVAIATALLLATAQAAPHGPCDRMGLCLKARTAAPERPHIPRVRLRQRLLLNLKLHRILKSSPAVSAIEWECAIRCQK